MLIDSWPPEKQRRMKKATNILPESWKNFHQMYANYTGLSKEIALTFHTFIAFLSRENLQEDFFCLQCCQKPGSNQAFLFYRCGLYEATGLLKLSFLSPDSILLSITTENNKSW